MTQAGELDGWFRKIDLTLNTSLTSGSEITTGVPTLVRLSSKRISGFSYDSFATLDGSDLLFVCNGAVVPHEIDTWDMDGESLVWVRIPSTAQGTTLTMYYGRATAPEDTSADVWDGYEGVWHLKEDSVGANNLTVHDSTANHYDGTAYTGAAVAHGHTVAGKLGKGWLVSETAASSSVKSIDGGIIIESMTNATLGSQFTISGWLYHHPTAHYYDHLFFRKNESKGNSGYSIEQFDSSSTTKMAIRGSDTSNTGIPFLNLTNAVVGGWAHVAITYDEKTAYIVNNGVEGGSVTVVAKATDNNLAVAFGNDSDRNDAPWVGSMDELRIRKGAYDANYAAAEYKAMNAGDEDVFTFGTIQPAGEYPLVTVNFVCDTDTQSFVARTDLGEIVSGASVEQGVCVTVTATPALGYSYPTAPAGWVKRGGNILGKFPANGNPTVITIPNATYDPERADWSRKVELTLAADLSSADIPGLPALVRLAEGKIPKFAFADFRRPDGSDMMFEYDGEVVPHELDTWNPNGESLVWVKLPSTAQGTKLTMYYGRETAPTDRSAEIWEGYTAVWHLKEQSDGAKDTEVFDSTTNHYDGIAKTGSASASGQAAAGKFGNGWRISGASGKTGSGILFESMTNATLGSQFTVSGWLWHDTAAGAYDHIFFRKVSSQATGGGFSVEVNANGKSTKLAVRGNSSNSTDTYLHPSVMGGWSHLSVAYDGGKAHVLTNGTYGAASTIAATSDNNLAYAVGNNSELGDYVWVGSVDELRVRTGAYDLNYLQAEYAAMNVGETDIFAFGSVEPTVIETVTVRVTCNTALQKYTLESAGETISSGASVWSNAFVTVNVTPGTGRAYPVAPEGWTKQGGRIVRTVQAASDPTVIVVPDSVEDPDLNGWKKKVSVKLASPLADIEIKSGVPALVRLSEEKIEGFSYEDFRRTDGADLIFIYDSQRLPHEVDTWNTNGESLVWVRLPSTAQDTEISLCFGRAKSPSDMSAEVWEGYTGVWHLNENSGGCNNTTVHDSTANGYDGTAYAGGGQGQTVEGALGNGWQVSTTKAIKNGGIIMHSTTNAVLGSQFTVSAWLWHDSTSGGWDHIFYRKNSSTETGGFASECPDNNWAKKIKIFGSGSQTSTLTLPDAVSGGWAHIALSYDGGTARLLSNGALSFSASGLGTPTDNGKAVAFGVDSDKGDCCWVGLMDELRIRTGALDTNYAAAEYKAMNVGETDIFTFGKVGDSRKSGLVLLFR